jgi:hypothetical protein
MSPKPKIYLTLRILFLLFLLVIGLLAGLYFYLPHYLESRILPQFIAKAGIADFNFSVRNIGLFGADLGVLRIGSGRNPAMVIRSVQVDYSPRGLFRRKIDGLTLNGIELYGVVANGRIRLPGVDIEKILMGTPPQDTSTPTLNDSSLLISLSSLAVHNSRIILEYNDQYYRVPFELEIVARDPHLNRLDGVAFLYPRGAKISASINLDRSQRKAALNIQSEKLDMKRFADLTSQLGDIMISGEMALQAKADLLWAPFRLSAVNASFILRRSEVHAGSLKFQNAVGSSSRETPFHVHLVQKNDDEWQMTGSGISMVSPTLVTLSGLNGTITRNKEMFAGTGNFTAVFHPPPQKEPLSLPMRIQDPLQLRGQFGVHYHHSGHWQCEVSDDPNENSPVQKVRLSSDQFKVRSSVPQFKLSAKSDQQIIDVSYTLKVPGVRIVSAAESIQFPQLTLNGTAQIANGESEVSKAVFDLSALNAGLKSDGTEIKISRISFSGKLDRNLERLLALDGVMKISGARGVLSDFNAGFSQARATIPFKWPAAEKSPNGSLSVASLKLNGRYLGGLKCRLGQTSSGFTFEGMHQSALLPRMKLAFSGESRLFHPDPIGASIRFDLSHPGGAPDVELEKIFPQAAGVRLNGNLQLKGSLTITSHGLSGSAKADFANGTLALDKNKLSLEGIRMSLDFPELPSIRSAPGQQLNFAKISLGNIIAKNGKIDFQIESNRSMMIEKIHFRWCNGNVETQPIRLSPDVEDYRLTLYCDRLNLAEVLEQFGAAKAEGKGTVSGRIPLQYIKSIIRFDDGFLFSTPGEGGKIYLSGTDLLTAGIPPDTPQFIQMELAAAALRDYDYAWAKLNLTSEGDELLLQMKMDGKPAKTLPFAYRKDIGGFVKVDANSKGSKFQGIRLDVNFRLPLNEMLQYKDLFKMIQ